MADGVDDISGLLDEWMSGCRPGTARRTAELADPAAWSGARPGYRCCLTSLPSPPVVPQHGISLDEP